MSSKYWTDIPQYSQPNASELRQKSAASRKKEKAKGKILEPVTTKGRMIVNEWWGKAWCDNLERYADYESRLDRGKRYIRTGAVIDLKIQKGKILARVQGTRKTPYKVEIRISPLSEEKCQAIIQRCGRKLENLEALLAGDFPEEMKELFQSKEGLFPSPNEISFSCSCPDWALLCKHVAAALYGVGVRLDENPLLFFELRGIEVGRFIDVTLANRVEAMLANAGNKTGRMLDEGSSSSSYSPNIKSFILSNILATVLIPPRSPNRFSLPTARVPAVLPANAFYPRSGYILSPNIPVPTRTMVAPSSIATS